MEKHKVCVAAKTSETIVLTQAQEDQRIAEEIDISVTQEHALIASLTTTDAAMARVTEDLIDVLIASGTMALTDLPQSAQDVIAEREQIRADIGA
jgi:hypothetical protein